MDVGLEPKEREWGMNENPLSDWTLAAFKQREEERRRREQAGVAEAQIVHEAAEATRRAKEEWDQREKSETALRAVRDRLQSKWEETRPVQKGEIVHLRRTARMIRGILSTLITAAIAGAIGFGAGVYATPADKSDEFRALVNSKLGAISNLIDRKRAAIEPETKAPSASATPVEPAAAPKQIQLEAPAQPTNDAPAGDAAMQKDIPDNKAIAPSAAPAESNDSQLTPAVNAESAAPVTPAPPPTAENAEKAPVVKPHAKAPAKKKVKRKKKPAAQHPKAKPAEPARADEPAQ